MLTLEPASGGDTVQAEGGAGPRRPERRLAARAVRGVAGAAMRLVPAGLRFGLAVRLARVAVPALRRTRAYGKLRQIPLNSDHDLALHLLLRAMIASGAPFPVPLRVEGGEVLEQALRSGRGTLIAAPHALLSLLVFRHLYDGGHVPTVLARDELIDIAGANASLTTIPVTSAALITLRGRLREGEVVCAMVDRLSTTGKNMVEVPTPAGTLRFSDALFRVAVRGGAGVVFVSGRTDGNAVRLRFASPSAASAEAVTAGFAEFVREHARALPPRTA